MPACRPVRLSGSQNVPARRGVVNTVWCLSAPCVSAPGTVTPGLLELAPGGDPGRGCLGLVEGQGPRLRVGARRAVWRVRPGAERVDPLRVSQAQAPTLLAGPRANSALCVSPTPVPTPGLVPEPAR